MNEALGSKTQILAHIVEVRTGGEVVAGRVERCFARAEEAAAEFGLSERADTYTQVAAQEAVAVLANVIHEDMAHGYEFVPLERARELAAAFVSSFPPQTTRYFTNGTFGKPRESQNIGASWSPATEATFDTGVLMLSSEATACLWFKDED
jgi:hypothetical protein